MTSHCFIMASIYTLLYCQMQECVIPDKETHEERA